MRALDICGELSIISILFCICGPDSSASRGGVSEATGGSPCGIVGHVDTFLLEIGKAAVMGVVEGVTEFLPISSTGHLIVVGEWIGFGGAEAATFDIFIQLGAILSVVWLYRARIFSFGQGWIRFWIKVFLSFLPAAIVGFFAHSYIKEHFFYTKIVAMTLIAGGIAMLIIEKTAKVKSGEAANRVSTKQALWVGVAQVFALVPGVSRSGATIMGGLLAGLDRRAATEWSFFLAIPTMFAATIYDLAKSPAALENDTIPIFGVGFLFAFVSAMIAIRTFMKFISTHTFRGFAWYRIIAGAVLAAGGFFNLF